MQRLPFRNDEEPVINQQEWILLFLLDIADFARAYLLLPRW